MFQTTKSLPQIIHFFQRIAQGEVHAKFYLKPTDLWHPIAQPGSKVAERLSQLFTEASNHKEQLQAVLSSLKEGLLILEPTGKVQFANECLLSIVGRHDITGMPYWKVFPEPPFMQLVQRAMEEKETLRGSIELQGKPFHYTIMPIPPSPSMLIFLQDLPFAELERKEVRLIANVSHELKTPLTAIKGFAETLAEKVHNQPEKSYLDIIQRHTERLIQIVEGLLLLTKINETVELQQDEKVDLCQIVEKSLTMFTLRCQKKNITLRVALPEAPVYVQGDPFLLEQVLINLLDNSLKYTDKGEIVVKVVADGACAELSIKDTGIGIPPDQQTRIFERFYTVDPSHSRYVGGAGLGLSIARRIVSLHCGEITLKSKPKEGSTFTVILPLSSEKIEK